MTQFKTMQMNMACLLYTSVGAEKTKKSDGNMNIELERTDDILAWLGAHRREGQVLCGFSMETQNMLENSRAKLVKKNVDMIVANSLRIAGAGFGTDTNIVTVITKDGAEELALMSKMCIRDSPCTDRCSGYKLLRYI